MTTHNCPGDGCGLCERRISDLEYARDYGDFDVDDYYDGS